MPVHGISGPLPVDWLTTARTDRRRGAWTGWILQAKVYGRTAASICACHKTPLRLISLAQSLTFPQFQSIAKQDRSFWEIWTSRKAFCESRTCFPWYCTCSLMKEHIPWSNLLEKNITSLLMAKTCPWNSYCSLFFKGKQKVRN